MRWLGQINSLPPSVGGGTFSKQNYTMLDNLFQSTHKGWDIRLLGDSGALYEFQSTHPQGVGPPSYSHCHIHHYFNPPTRKGWDHQLGLHQRPDAHFNPPTRTGWDALAAATACVRELFQSTHPQGVGQLIAATKPSASEFQSTHPQGVGRTQLEQLTLLPAFQSTHPQGMGLGV